MVNYKDIGLSNQVEMMQKALKEGYAIPGYNMNNMEQMQAILTDCVKSQSPVILQVSKGARNYANETILRYMAQGGVQFAKELAEKEGLKQIPISLNLDHGDSFELCKSCIATGFSAVMIDRSKLPLDENITQYDLVGEAITDLPSDCPSLMAIQNLVKTHLLNN